MRRKIQSEMKQIVFFMLLLHGMAVTAYGSGRALSDGPGFLRPGGSGQSAGSGSAASPREMEFVLYLMARDELDEALYLLNRMQGFGRAGADSISYLKGWTLYRQKELLPSAAQLLEVSETSPFYVKSRFFAAYNLAHMGHVADARSVLASATLPGGALMEDMRSFQFAGMALLDKDFEGFARHSEGFGRASHLFSEEAGRMLGYHDDLRQFPSRSPLLAGALSAAVPGLGKIYAGKTAEGIAGFLYVAAMGATAWDFHRGAGPGSVLFILSASVTGIFYIGNIWGSAVAVIRQRNEFRHEMDQRILFDMHIPLRNAFN